MHDDLFLAALRNMQRHTKMPDWLEENGVESIIKHIQSRYAGDGEIRDECGILSMVRAQSIWSWLLSSL